MSTQFLEACFLLDCQHLNLLYFWFSSSKSLADLTAQMESLSGYGPGPVGSGGGGGAMVPRGEATLYMENQLVRESLEKEMFRRKHCEKQIHLLQSKVSFLSIPRDYQ